MPRARNPGRKLAVSASLFVSGTTVLWEELAETIFGGFLAAQGSGFAWFLYEVLSIPVAVLRGVAEFNATLISLAFVTPQTGVRHAWTTALASLAGYGALAPVIAAVELVIVYMAASLATKAVDEVVA